MTATFSFDISTPEHFFEKRTVNIGSTAAKRDPT